MTKQAKQLIAQAKAENWKRLELGNCGLTDLEAQVPELFTLTDLEELVLSNVWQEWNEAAQKWESKVSSNKGEKNRLSKLPPALGNLKALLVFICGDWGGGHWPISDISPLSHLTALKNLYLANNQISDITPLAGLTALNELYLSNNKISDITPLAGLTALNELVLESNKISDIAPLAGLTALNKLGLSENQISDIARLERLTALNKLWLGSNKITDITPLAGLAALNELYLSRNKISDIQPLVKLSILEVLSLNDNQISDITSLARLATLHTLKLQRNKISNIIPLAGLTALNELYLSENQISDITLLAGLVALNELYLANNQITNITPLAGLTALNNLYLSKNKISDITPLAGLAALNKLDLSENQISNVSSLLPLLQREPNPLVLTIKDWYSINDREIGIGDNPLQVPSILSLTKYRYLINNREIRIGDNPLQVPPIEIVEQGREAVLRYFEQLIKARKQEIPDYINKEVKLVLVGNSTVGKTTLAEYLYSNELSDKHPSTHWMERKDPNIDGYEVRLFDFGGQEYYHDTHHLFFSSDTAYILLWNKQSNCLGSVKTPIRYQQDGDACEVDLYHFPLEYWLEAIQFYAKIQPNTAETPILVAQTHVDALGDTAFLNQHDLCEQYPNIVNFVAVSLKANGTMPPLQKEQLAYIKGQISAMLKQMKVLDKVYPGSWGLIKDAVKHKAKSGEQPILSIKEFREFCNDVLKGTGIFFSEADTIAVCKTLTILGYLLYYDTLPDKVFVNETYITNCIYKILQGLEQQQGVFDEQYVEGKLSECNPKQRTDILTIMQHFHIIFPLDDSYIAPLYLPEKPLEPIELFLVYFSKPKVRFQYKAYMHKSIVLHFFAEFGRHVLQESNPKNPLYYYWRNGIILANPKRREEIVLVRFNLEGKCVDVVPFLQDDNTDYLKSIVEKLSRINEGWAVSKLVTANGVDFVPLSEIEENEEAKYWVFQYDNKQFFLKDFKAYLKEKVYLQKMFIVYSKKDVEYLSELETHLSLLKRRAYINTWHNLKLVAGEESDKKIKAELDTADIILLLLSPDFLASDYIWDIELKKAIERHNEKKAVLIPIILRPCEWERTPLVNIKSAHNNAQPISTAPDRDTIWLEIITNIRDAIENPHSHKQHKKNFGLFY